MTVSYDAIMETIGRVAEAEKITKAGLSTLSRDILEYVLETEDVRPVNALLGQGDDGKFVLTPINWRIAVQYFHYFIAFSSNYEEEVKEYAVKGKGKRAALVFNKKSKKRWDKCAKLIAEWLEDPANDIWHWSNNAEMDAQPVDYAKKIQTAVKAALDEDKGGMSVRDVISAMAELEEVGIHDIMGALDSLTTPASDEQEAA